VLAAACLMDGVRAAAQDLPKRLPASPTDEPLWSDETRLTNEAKWATDADTQPAYRLAQSTEAIGMPAVAQPPIEAVEAPAAPAQRGIFQGVELNAGWMPRMDDDALGHTNMSAAVSFGVPPLLFDTPLLITPRAGLHLFDGPSTIDVPSSVNDFDLSFATFKTLNERWSVRGSVSVGLYGDDYSLDDSDALRFSGFAAAVYQASEEWQWMFGAAYLNRDDLSVIPVAGFIRDCGDVRYEIMMPRPRIVWRLPQDEAGAERAVYIAGDLGGGAWAVQRADGTTDTLNLSSYGFGIGYETKAGPGSFLAGKRRYELGYVFGRSVEYQNTGEDVSLDDSLVARVGWSY
jgi:hypothetical protein